LSQSYDFSEIWVGFQITTLVTPESFGTCRLQPTRPLLFFDHTRCKSFPIAIQLQLPGLSIVADTRRRLLVRPLCVPTFQRSGSGSGSQRLLPRSHSAPTNLRPRVPHSSSIPFAARTFLPPSVSSCLDGASFPTLQDDSKSALSIRFFRDLVRGPDHNACYLGLIQYPRTYARVSLTPLRSHSL
jgi:hypothetical protein